MPSNASTPKVLVVDDDPLIRSLVSEILDRSGYEVVLAANGWECLRQIQDCRPDLIILDLDMPHVRGDTAINMIRNHEGMRDIPIIVVSGHASTESLQELKFFEFGTFIPKPFDPEELIRHVRTHLVCLDHESVSSLLYHSTGKDQGLSILASQAAGRRCDVYVSRHEGIELRVLIPEELTRLEKSLLSEPRLSERITVLADLGTHWRRIWPKATFADPKRRLLTLTR